MALMGNMWVSRLTVLLETDRISLGMTVPEGFPLIRPLAEGRIISLIPMSNS